MDWGLIDASPDLSKVVVVAPDNIYLSANSAREWQKLPLDSAFDGFAWYGVAAKTNFTSFITGR